MSKKIWRLKCDVTLSNAEMVISADTKEEAIEKARADNWDDITYETAHINDWTPLINTIQADE